MLFQMCYGPEIKSIYDMITKYPGLTIEDLRKKFQYQPEGDISSLIDGVATMLKEFDLIHQAEGSLFSKGKPWDVVEIFRKLRSISATAEKESLNFVFASLYDTLFVKPDRLFITNMHYPINVQFEKTMIGHEKINAWKRIMEYFGLGFRVYTGFYALPQLSLIKQIIQHNGTWEGALHDYCEKKIDPIIPCITSGGNVFAGMVYGLAFLNQLGCIKLSSKQDLPYKSYGQGYEWNWICISKVEEKSA